MCYRLRKGFDVNLTTGLKLNFFIKFPHWIVLKIHAEFPMPCSSIPMLFSGSPVSHFLFYLLFSLFPLPSGRHASGNQESWRFPSLKSVPKQFPLVLTQPSPPRRLFLASESVTRKIDLPVANAFLNIAGCVISSHILAMQGKKPSPLLKISWKPGTCKPRWDFVELWLVILKQIQFGPSLSLLFSWWQIFNQHACSSVNLRVKDSSQDISPVLGLNFSLQCHRNFRSVYQGDSLYFFEKNNICNEKSAWYSLKCDLLRHLRRQKSEKKKKKENVTIKRLMKKMRSRF